MTFNHYEFGALWRADRSVIIKNAEEFNWGKVVES